MPEIQSVLATVDYSGWHLETLQAMFAPAPVHVVDPDDDVALAEALATADVAILRADLDARYATSPSLKWIHCDHAGLNKSAIPEVFAREDLVVTGSAGRAAPALAQHTVFLMLALTYDSSGLERDRQNHQWRGTVDYSERRGLYGKTMGIVGMGYTGVELVKLGKALGMNVLGFGRGEHQNVAGIDTYYDASLGDTIDELLAASDFVVLAVRLTDETYRMVGPRELGIMKRTAYVVNIGRGHLIDEAALVTALHDGTIAGAGLDVFEQEPLPPEAAIWDAPNVVLTHHQTAEMPDLRARSLDIISENVRRYRAGEALLNALKPSDVYSR